MTSLSPLLIDASVLPMVELLALCLDGHLYRVGDAFATAATPDCPDLRAHAFALSAPDWAVADRGTAAWIHGTRATPPPLPQVCVPPRRRGRVSSPLIDACHRALRPDEVTSLGRTTVTTPLRTAEDLISTPSAFGSAQALEVRHLLALAGVTPPEFDDRLRASRRMGRALARTRVPAVARAALPGPILDEQADRPPDASVSLR
ncbi:type IV toxin-antitoxin system AbiEi family antitoxin [Leifsonia sp. LS-T14]|uniref:type IV toxin-antitoxin system AbiEi family antitoxin n=1 Tax=unclassified Leifsonia TaxID=2663824 RepID=UPI0035A6CA39